MQKVFTKAKSVGEAYHLFRNLMFSLKLEFHFFHLLAVKHSYITRVTWHILFYDCIETVRNNNNNNNNLYYFTINP